jgi:hypothetical protein
MHKKYYKGGRWWLSLSPGCGESYESACGESCESMFGHGLSMHQKCFNYTLTNLLFGLCRSMWIIDSLVTCPSPHPKAPTHPFTPKVVWAKERGQTPCPFVIFTFGFIVEYIQEFGGVSLLLLKWTKDNLNYFLLTTTTTKKIKITNLLNLVSKMQT